MKSVAQIRQRIGELDELIASHTQIIKDAEIAKQTYESAISIVEEDGNIEVFDENIPLIQNPKRKHKTTKGQRKGFREGSRPYMAQMFLLKCGKPMGIPEIAKACDVTREDYRSFGSGLADKSRAGNVFIKMDRGVYGLIELLGQYG